MLFTSVDENEPLIVYMYKNYYVNYNILNFICDNNNNNIILQFCENDLLQIIKLFLLWLIKKNNK